MSKQQQQIVIAARQKSEILDNLEDEWMYLRQRIKIQETIWKNFEEPTHKEEIQENKKWAEDLKKLISLYTKLHIVNLQYQQKKAESDLKLYTWQKPLSKKTTSNLFQKQVKILDEYYKLKKQFIKEYPI